MQFVIPGLMEPGEVECCSRELPQMKLSQRRPVDISALL
jgi:hypothetical protein